jgi:hypothetical protein
MKTFKSFLKEISESIEISDDKSTVTISVDGKDRFMLQPAEGHKLKSYSGRAYKYWTIYDIERKKTRINPAIGMMTKNQAIAHVKKLVRLENKGKGGGWKSVSEETERLSFKDFIAERCWPGYKEVKGKKAYAPGSCVKESAAWQRKEGKNPEGGLNRKGIESYRRENPGSKLSMAVTTPPSELKPGSKAANRRKSFCARMGGMEGPMKKPNGEPTRKALSLRKWNC